MPKKKQKSIKAQPAKKKDNSILLWGLGVLILIVVIILLVKGCGKEVPAKQEPAAPTEPAAPIEPQKQLTGFSEASNCDAQSAIGFVQKTCSKLENGNVQLKILHRGTTQLLGFQYKLYDANGVEIGKSSEMSVVEGGAEATLILPVSGTAGTAKVEITPLINKDGVDTICKNQRIMQIMDRC